MKKAIFVILLSIMLFGCASVKPECGKIEITGQGSVTAKTDIAVFSLSLNTLKETTSEAVAELKQLQSQVIKVLEEECGIAPDDIISTSLYFSPSYSWVDGKQVLNGQQASASYSLTVRDIDSIGSVYDMLSAISSISLSNISLQVEDKSAYVAEARTQAVQNAKEIASLYAENLGLELGEVLYINEGSSSNYYKESVSMAPKMMMSANSDSLDYRQDKVTVSATVNVVFTLK